MGEETEEHPVRDEKSLQCGVNEVRGKEDSKSIGWSSIGWSRESNAT